MRKIIFLALSFLFILSCDSEFLERSADNQNKILNKDYIRTASHKEQLLYKEYYLKRAVKLIKKLGFTANELNLDKSQKSKISINEIISITKKKNKIVNKEILDELDYVSNAFKQIDSVDYNISIYMPFINNKTSDLIVSKTADVLFEEIYIFEGEDNSNQLAFEGEILNEDGDFVTYEQEITEELAESLSQEGTMILVVGLEEEAGAGYPIIDWPPSHNNYVNVLDVAIKQHKESWIAGGSEVVVQAVVQKDNKFYNAIGPRALLGTLEGPFVFMRRKSIRDQKLVTLNSSIIHIDNESPRIDPLDNNYFLHYVIYETDNWPTRMRDVTFTSNGLSHKVSFRSSDTPYDYKTFVGHTVPTDYIDLLGIKYRIYYGDRK